MNNDLDTASMTLHAADAHKARLRLASEHASLFPTRLALARWTHGGDLPHLAPGAPARRAAWYADAGRDLQAWLEHGGFAQHDEPCAWPMPPLAPVPPARDGDTEQLGACT
ncbi:hypothetical protein [Massilia niastensis]|uniref:hypothetical protein n=1 Tax=Massilia niastensis TaxID=544911 RepID=UPI00035F94A2|nr:hypothetical protein [Massilia niastensis]